MKTIQNTKRILMAKPSTLRLKIKMLASLFILVATSSVHAASIVATTSTNEIMVGETAIVEIALTLSGKEQASVFDGVFDISGLETVAIATLNAGGSSWASAFGGLVDDQVRLSLTSNNQGGKRLIATLQIVGSAPGTFDITFNSMTLAAFDIDEAPFLQGLVLNNDPNGLLASISVSAVPIPPTFLMLSSALVALFGFRRNAIA